MYAITITHNGQSYRVFDEVFLDKESAVSRIPSLLKTYQARGLQVQSLPDRRIFQIGALAEIPRFDVVSV